MHKVTCLLLVVLASMAHADEKPQYDLNKAEELFEKFIIDYNKEYKDDDDKKVHFEEFVKSLRVINKANAEQSSATFDINAFADYTPEQRKYLHGGKRPSLSSQEEKGLVQKSSTLAK